MILIYETVFDYIESTIDTSEQYLIVGDFYAPHFINHLVDADPLVGCGTVCITLSNVVNFQSLRQHNSARNSNSRILYLVLASNEVDYSVSKCGYPLVDKDMHHPSDSIRIFFDTTNENF